MVDPMTRYERQLLHGIILKMIFSVFGLVMIGLMLWGPNGLWQ